MNYPTFAKKYKGKTLEDSGSYVSKDFQSFARSFRALMKENAATHGWQIEKYSVGHYYLSGFLSKGEKHLYFSYSPARLAPLNLESPSALNGVLLRIARDSKDYTGGRNHFCSVKDIATLIGRFSEAKTML